MATATLKIGPADHRRPMTLEEFDLGERHEGYRYELIDGRLHVTPAPNPKHDVLWDWIYWSLNNYRHSHPKIVQYVSGRSRVFLTGRRGVTIPEPDIAVYAVFPRELALADDIDWRQVSPMLVIEILSADDSDKDLVRNVDLYEQVQSIREYWILDPRDDATRPSLRVFRRRGTRWQKPIDVNIGETYTTKLLPGFCFRLDPLA